MIEGTGGRWSTVRARRRPDPDRPEPLGPDEVLVSMPAPLALGLVLVWFAMAVVGAVWYSGDPTGMWFFAGSVACLVVSLPLVVGRYEVLSPWTLVIGAVYIACGLRGLAISAGWEGSRSLDQLYLRGHGVDYFLVPTLYYLLGLTTLTAGYLLARSRRRPVRPPRIGGALTMDAGRVRMAVVACAALGFAGFLLFVESTGGFSLGTISAKRTLISGVDLGSDYQSHGQYRVLAEFAPIALWLQLAWYCHKRVPHGLTTLQGGWLAVLFLNAALLPVFASSRADLVYVLVGALLIEYCLGGQRIRWRPLVTVLALVLVLAPAISSLRNASDSSVAGVNVDQSELIDTFVLTRTFADIPTSGNIINAVPEVLPYAHGSTIAAWLVAPIPRAVWPDKPLISSGPILGNAVFGNTRSGVPPGILAESYWNFGLPGILLLPLLCGILIRRFAEYWRPWAKTSPAAAIVMATAAVHPGIDMMTNSIGAAPYQALVSLVLLTPVLAFVAGRREDAAESPSAVTAPAVVR